MRIRMNGKVYQGSADEIVEQIRQGWYWQPIPTVEELFQFASGMLKRPIKTAEAYIKAMIDIGVAKIVEEEPVA